MAWTNPNTAAGGGAITSALWNTYVRDNLLYLKAAVDGQAYSGVRCRMAGDQGIVPGNYTNLIWDAADDWDVGAWHAVGSASIIVPAAVIPSGATRIALGIEGSIYWEGNSTGLRHFEILKNGVSVGGGRAAPGFSNTWIQTVAGAIDAVAGDTIVIQVLQTTNVTLAVGGATSSIHVHRLGVVA